MQEMARAVRRGWQQLELETRTWGGKRERAGRKRAARRRVPHRRRPAIGRRTVLHVTVKILGSVGVLRGFDVAPVLRHVFAGAAHKDGFRLCHFSIQRRHVHLIVEADSKLALSSGMRGFNIRLGRRLNRRLGRSGPVVADRYHTVKVKTPRHARSTLVYVLQNGRRHGERIDPHFGGIDPFSSAWYFDGWSRDDWRACVEPADGPPCVAESESWLLRTGWRRYGLVDPEETPPASGSH
jgi:REP element-mobilizing transposase RayT